MGRAPCCSKVGLQRGPWTPQEDSLLINYIKAHGEGLWRSLPKKAGLLRCGKSCRLRWLNYLRPDIKRGNISPDEDDMIIRLHALLGNKWSLIAGRLPGRTDNEIKNYWNTHLSKRLWSEGIDPNTHKKVSDLTPCPTPCRRKRSSAKNRKREMSSETGSDENTTIPRVNVHFPKPVRVTSIKRNSSLASFESDVTNVSALTGDGSGGAAVHGEAMAAEHGEGMTMEEFWPSDDQNVVCDGMEMMVVDGDYDVADLGVQEQGLTLHPHAADLDKIYDEYFQLLKSDDEHVYLDGDQALELDSFAESLLI